MLLVGVWKKFGIKNNFSTTPPSNLNYDWSLSGLSSHESPVVQWSSIWTSNQKKVGFLLVSQPRTSIHSTRQPWQSPFKFLFCLPAGALTKGDRRAATGADLTQFNFDTPYGRSALRNMYQAISLVCQIARFRIKDNSAVLQ